MRHHFQAEPDLQITPIEKIRLPLRSRDELPPILAGLQWLWMHPTLRAEVLVLLEAAVLAGKAATGRTGMDLWQILALGVVRLGLDADWDRLEHIANYDALVRQMLGVPATPWGQEAKVFGHQTLRDNVALLDDELLRQISRPPGPGRQGDACVQQHDRQRDQEGKSGRAAKEAADQQRDRADDRDVQAADGGRTCTAPVRTEFLPRGREAADRNRPRRRREAASDRSRSGVKSHRQEMAGFFPQPGEGAWAVVLQNFHAESGMAHLQRGQDALIAAPGGEIEFSRDSSAPRVAEAGR